MRKVSHDGIVLTEAQRKLIEGCVPLAHDIGHQMFHGHPAARYVGDEDEIISIGKMGLIQASLNYDPERAAFSTCATNYIKGYILHAIYRVKGKPKMHHFEDDDDEEHRFDRPMADPVIRWLLERVRREMTVREWKDHETERMLALMPMAMATMNARLRHIIQLMFLDPRGTRTLREVGKIIGVSKERIRQLKEKALEHLEEYLRPRRQSCCRTG